jgi:hypothetical protein
LITGAQLRAARALVRWSAEELAAASHLGVATIRRAEAVDGQPPITAANRAAAQRALEAAGVEFTNGGQPGVRMKAFDFEVSSAGCSVHNDNTCVNIAAATGNVFNISMNPAELGNLHKHVMIERRSGEPTIIKVKEGSPRFRFEHDVLSRFDDELVKALQVIVPNRV